MEVLGRFRPSAEFLFLAATFSVKSLATLALPFCPSLAWMQAVEFLYGLCHGSFHSVGASHVSTKLISDWRQVGNLLQIRIWAGSGHDSSPYMYALHFCYGLGALLTPVLAKPFLRPGPNTTLEAGAGLEAGLEAGLGAGQDQLWTIKTLYPIIFLLMALPTPGFLYHFIQDNRKERKLGTTEEAAAESEAECGAPLSGRRAVLLLVPVALFYFTMAGVEHGFRSFTAVFCVNSALAMSRNQAADILAVFYATFAGVRGLMIPVSTVLSAASILAASALTLLAGTSLLAAWGDTSVTVLRLGIALAGAGVAAMFAAGMLWIKNVVRCT